MSRESALELLCELTGEDRDRVFANAIHLLSWRHYSLRGNPFTAEFLHGKTTMFCPNCLAEDDAGGGRRSSVGAGPSGFSDRSGPALIITCL